MTHQCKVLEARTAGPRLLLLTLDCRGTPVPASHLRSGQYVTLATPHSAPGYFSIASPPGSSRLTFLIRIEPYKAKTAGLIRLRRGDLVTVSEASGDGFPLDQFEGADLLLVGTGTGIAPLRALLHELRPKRDRFGQVTLVYGAVDQPALAFHDEFLRWKRMGVDVIPVLSRAQPGWVGRRGYVQHVIRQLPLNAGETTAFLCGRPANMEKVADILIETGLKSRRIFRI